MATEREAPAGDAITSEIIRHALIAIPDQIDVNITRTAYSPLIYEYKDYAVGIVDTEGRLVSQCKGAIPLFVTNALGTAVLDGIEIYGEGGIEPGDVVITNYVGSQGQHLNNVVMYTPVHAEGGTLFGFVAIVVHWVDIGGSAPGSISGRATEIFQEGLHLRTVKLVVKGEPVPEIYRIIEMNSRTPEMLFGDIEAQLAGCQLGRTLVEDLIGRYGAEAMRTAIATAWDRSEAAARAAIAEIPDGIYRAQSVIDGDGINPGRKVRVDVEVRISGSDMCVDLSDVEGQVDGPFNSGLKGGAETAARIAFKYLTVPGEPANEGAFRPLSVICPEGRFLNARPGAPMGLYSAPLATVIDTIVLALAPACPERAAAGHSGDFALFRIYGSHPETGALFNVFGSGFGGWGALDGMDGSSPFKTMAHGDVLEVPTELHEAFYPVRVVSYEFRADSGGAGRYRGGLGLTKHYRVLAPAKFYCSFDRLTTLPWGLEGGGEGTTGDVVLHRPGEPDQVMHKEWDVPVGPGDVLEVRTGGGGGFGPAFERDPEAVALDVRRGYVSREAARKDYGVELDAAGEVNLAATQKLRGA